MKIKTKLIGGFTLATLLTAIVGMIGFMTIFGNVEMINHIISEDVDYLKSVKDLNMLALQHRRYEKDFFLNIGKSEKQNKYIDKFNTVSEKTQKELEGLVDHISNDPELSEKTKQAALNAQSAYHQYYESFIQLAQRVLADPTITPQKANKMMAPFKEQIYAFENNVEKLVVSGTEMIDAVAVSAKASGHRVIVLIVLIMAIGTFISAVIGFWVIKSINEPISNAVKFVEKMATGDFSETLKVKRKDEMGIMMGALNKMITNPTYN